MARIASGGELSRIMLALKTLTAGAGEVPTLIFDEVDAGIGGAVAEAVGKRLHVVGQSRQVLCITHLPQIAAQAEHHFAVEKRVVKGRTTTSARALQADDRVREITRMLGGTSTMESQQYARRLMAGVGEVGRQQLARRASDDKHRDVLRADGRWLMADGSDHQPSAVGLSFPCVLS